MKKILTVLGIISAVLLPLSTVSAASIVHKNSSWRTFSVATSRGTFTGQVITINLTNPKLHVYTQTGNLTDCKTNCTVAPLKKYVDRVRGFAGINGTYFCPAEYPSCSGQTGSYYWMVYNTLRHVFINQKQNRFNLGPLVAFDTENHWHFWREARDWPGLAAFEDQYDTKLTALISNGPALMVGGKLVVTASELDNKQRTVKSARSALAFKGVNAYLIVVNGATVLDSGAVMKAFGMSYAMNLDGGGSSALVFDNQYRVGPGRNIPNALIFSEYLVQ